MKLTLRRDLGGYALPVLDASGIDGVEITKPFVLLTGPNGSGKSGLMQAIRGSLGIYGMRGGSIRQEFARRHNPKDTDDVELVASHVLERGQSVAAKHIPAVFDLKALGWAGQQTYYFDAREASGIATKSSFDDDIGYHISMMAGGAGNVSHGQFLKRTWHEAIEWATGGNSVKDVFESPFPGSVEEMILHHGTGGSERSTERWLFLDEPETAIDTEAFLIGLSALLKAAEIGTLRIFCASHSLLWAAGLVSHPKIQSIEFGEHGSWLGTQMQCLRLANNLPEIDRIGADILQRFTEDKPAAKRKRSKTGSN